MKNKTPLTDGLRMGPERTTLNELVGETAQGTCTLAYVYPHAAVRGHVNEVCTKLNRRWKERGFVVAVCSSTKVAIQNIRQGEAWIVWERERDFPSLRVLVMQAGFHPGQ